LQESEDGVSARAFRGEGQPVPYRRQAGRDSTRAVGAELADSRYRNHLRVPSGAKMLIDPIVLVEILSPSNEAETRANVWAYTTIPTVAEIVLLR
jgi:hypothetical protein